MSLYWMYAVLEPPVDAVGIAGARGEPLEIVPVGPVAVACGVVEARLDPTADILTAQHAAVTELARRASATLPLRFGECATDEADLTELVTERLPELIAGLAQVRGRVQMTLRVFATHAAAAAAGAPRAEEDPGPEATVGPGTAFLRDRRHVAARERTLPEIAELRRAVQPLVAAERVVRADRPPLVGTVHDLLAVEAVDAYRAVVSRHGGEARGYRVSLSGPGAPWAFAEISPTPHRPRTA